MTDYPWDKCIEDQIKAGYSEETAKKICGKIKAMNNKVEQDKRDFQTMTGRGARGMVLITPEALAHMNENHGEGGRFVSGGGSSSGGKGAGSNPREGMRSRVVDKIKAARERGNITAEDASRATSLATYGTLEEVEGLESSMDPDSPEIPLSGDAGKEQREELTKQLISDTSSGSIASAFQDDYRSEISQMSRDLRVGVSPSEIIKEQEAKLASQTEKYDKLQKFLEPKVKETNYQFTYRDERMARSKAEGMMKTHSAIIKRLGSKT